MGTLRHRGDTWRAEVFKRGVRDSATFPNRQQAVDWIVAREALINNAVDVAGHTFGEAVERRSATAGLSRWDLLRLRAFPQAWHPLPLSAITSDVIAGWRDARLQQVSPGTVLRERTVLRSLFTVARREWKWVSANPVVDVRPPDAPQPRRRVIEDDERDAMIESLGYEGRIETIGHETAVAFLIALETGMRAGEILGLLPEHVNGNVAHVARSKTGPSRDVALSTRAVALFDVLRRKNLLNARKTPDGRLFHVNGPAMDVTFRRARVRAALSGFTFHDARATAITRLSKILDPRQLARMVGHSSLNSLMIYYAEPPSSIASRLG